MPAEFTCEGCGQHIVAMVLTEPPSPAHCAGCQMLGPETHNAILDRMPADAPRVRRLPRCPRCDGLGRMTPLSAPCMMCDGTGELPRHG